MAEARPSGSFILPSIFAYQENERLVAKIGELLMQLVPSGASPVGCYGLLA
jgi:hypothetical protein